MLYLGGIGTMIGPIIGAIVASLLPEVLRGIDEVAGHRLCRGAAGDADLCAEGPVVARQAVPPAQQRGGVDHGAALGHKASPSASAVWSPTTRSIRRRRRQPVRRDRPERRRQDHVVQHDLRLSAARRPAVSCSTAATSPACRRTEIAAMGLIRTYQLVQLFKDMTVTENVEVGCHLVTRGGVAAALLRPAWVRQQEIEVRERAARASRLRRPRRPGRHDADILPYGQQRLLEVARALAAEAAAAAARRARRRSQHPGDRGARHMIQRINARGITVLLIEHDMGLVMRIAQRIAVLDFGTQDRRRHAGRDQGPSRRDRRLSRRGGRADA